MKYITQGGRIHYHEKPKSFFSDHLGYLTLLSQTLPNSLKEPSIKAYCCCVWLAGLCLMRLFEMKHSFLLVKMAYLDFNFGDTLLFKKI